MLDSLATAFASERRALMAHRGLYLGLKLSTLSVEITWENYRVFSIILTDYGRS